MAIIRGMWSVARGSMSGGRLPSAAMSAWNAAVVRSVSARIVSPFFCAAALILSSMSVMLRT
jgi:hypothetical protein